MSNAPTPDKTVAFIDIGTNSIRLLLVRIAPNGAYTTLSVQKEIVRLGDGEFSDGYLRQDAMQRATVVCQQFAEMARSNHADEIIAVATSATREARNKGYFIHKLRREAQLEASTISGIEEARLIYLGIANNYHMNGKTALMIDIGGGSTEMILGDTSNYFLLDSMKLGAIRLTSKFFRPGERGPVAPNHLSLIKQHIRNTTIRSVQRLKPLTFDLAIGSSGTIENLADIAVQLERNRPRQPGEGVSYAQVRAAVEHMSTLSLEERAQMPGINPKRADIIIAGAAIILTLMEELGVQELNVTDATLRDGLLVDYLKRSEHAAVIEEGSVRFRSVLQLAKKCGVDEEHAQIVGKLARSLFDSAKQAGLHNLGQRPRQLLEYATMLHDVGIFLSYSNHQRHSYYLIRNADLVGFDQNEIATIAATAYFHRKKFPQKNRRQMAELNAKSRKVVKVNSTLLRIAESLDRSHQGIVTQARIEPGADGFVYLDITCDQDCQLELWGLHNHVKTFRRVFGVPYEVRVLEEGTAEA